MSHPKESLPAASGMSLEEFKTRLRARARSRDIPPDDLERLLPAICAARPFIFFPDSYKESDIRDLETTVSEWATPTELDANDQRELDYITEMFHPDMNYYDIRVAIAHLLKLRNLVREFHSQRNEWEHESPIRECLRACYRALWDDKPTQLELDALASGKGTEVARPVPVPMLLSCPMCHTRHFDEGEFATKPHHTHACQGFVVVEGKRRRCGHVWRPALVPTVGVEALPGFVNEAPADG